MKKDKKLFPKYKKNISIYLVLLFVIFLIFVLTQLENKKEIKHEYQKNISEINNLENFYSEKLTDYSQKIDYLDEREFLILYEIFYREKNYHNNIILMDRAIKEYSNRSIFHTLKAFSYIKLNNYSDASKAINTSIRLLKKNDSLDLVYLGLAKINYLKGNYHKSPNYFNLSLKTKSKIPYKELSILNSVKEKITDVINFLAKNGEYDVAHSLLINVYN